MLHRLAFSPSTRRALSGAIALLGGAGVLLAAPDAGATIAIAGDLEADVPVGSASDLDTATGLALRLGWHLHLPAVVLTPEIGWHHAEFGDLVTLNRGIAGARLAFGEIFRVGGFAHVGFANVSFEVPGASDTTQFTYDIGAFFDFTVIPLLNVGVHTGYARVEADDDGDALKWIPLGVHVELVL